MLKAKKAIDVLKIKSKLEQAHNRRQAKYEREHNKNSRKSWFKPYTRTKFEFSIPYKPRLEMFKYKARSTVEFNPRSYEAHSYGHWRFVWLQNNKLVFNDYSYSVTTRRHQWDTRSLLRELGLKPFIIADLGRDGTLNNLYYKLYTLEMENSRENSRVSRKDAIRELKALIAKCESIGLKIKTDRYSSNAKDVTESAAKAYIKKSIQDGEANRLANLAQVKAERKAVRDRIKMINTTEPAKLKTSEIETEENAEIRRMLVNRIGMVRVLKELNAEVLDKQGDYELVDLKLKADANTWEFPPRRPYLKMVNPSTGEIHVEGVAPHIETVEQALAWRNGVEVSEFTKPIKLT